MAIDRNVFDRLALEAIRDTPVDLAKDVINACRESPVLEELRRIERKPSAQFHIAFSVGFLAGRNYEVADALAKVAVDSGEKAT